nr:hypothetical protein [Tanacetum cinerariifolium]
MSYISDVKEFNGGYVTFGGRVNGGRIAGKQHKAFCKSKIQNSISQPLFMLPMDLFGPTFVSRLMHKQYGLVVTNDYSRYTWVFFLATKDVTTGILKKFTTEIENLVNKKVKVIRFYNETEFKNSVMNDFCAMKGIRREFSVARTPQQNGVTKRRNRTLIEAARTMLADSKLPTIFWAEAVNTACYVQNRVLVVIPHNKTPYELFRCRTPALSFMRPFGKVYKVYNIRTGRVEENLHIEFLKNNPIVAGDGPEWLFDIDILTKLMNYVPVVVEPTSVTKALSNPALIEAMQEELLQFKLQKVWILVDLPKGEKAIGTKWVFRNKKDKRGTVIKNKARIEEEVYVCQPLGFKDPDHPDKELCIEFERLMKDKFQMSSMGELTFFLRLQVKQKEDGIFISQDKYVAEVLRKFNFSYVKSASTPEDMEKTLVKDADGDDVDVHLYRSMIRSLMYLTGPDIINMKRGFSGEHTPLFPSILAIQAEEGEGSRHPSEPQPPSSTAQPNNKEPVPNVASSSSHQKTQTPRQALNKVTKVERAATTAASLDAEQASGNINRTQSTIMPNVPLPQGISVGGSPRFHEAMGISIAQTRSERVPTPSYNSPLLGVHTPKRVTLVQIDAKDQGKVTPTQVSAQGEVHSQEYKFKDQLGVLNVAKYCSGEISISSRLFSTAEESASTAGASIPVSIAGMVQEVNIPSPVVVKDKGKGKMKESKDEQTKKTKLQQEQDRLGYEAAVRLQEELDEEERQRMARVHKAAQSFTKEE